jgi:hypothetical protein
MLYKKSLVVHKGLSSILEVGCTCNFLVKSLVCYELTNLAITGFVEKAMNLRGYHRKFCNNNNNIKVGLKLLSTTICNK